MTLWGFFTVDLNTMSWFFAVGILFFSGRCYSILRMIICCEKRKECHRLLDLIHAMAYEEISHRMLEKRSTNSNRTCNLY